MQQNDRRYMAWLSDLRMKLNGAGSHICKIDNVMANAVCKVLYMFVLSGRSMQALSVWIKLWTNNKNWILLLHSKRLSLTAQNHQVRPCLCCIFIFIICCVCVLPNLIRGVLWNLELCCQHTNTMTPLSHAENQPRTSEQKIKRYACHKKRPSTSSNV